MRFFRDLSFSAFTAAQTALSMVLVMLVSYLLGRRLWPYLCNSIAGSLCCAANPLTP